MQPAGIEKEFIGRFFQDYVLLKEKYTQGITESKLRDYSNPFRQMVYENKDEMFAVLGKPESNSFIKMQKHHLVQINLQVKALLDRWAIKGS